MAKQCCVCKCKLGFLDNYWEIDYRYSNYLLCPQCQDHFKKLSTCTEDEYENHIRIFKPLLLSGATPADIRDKFPPSPKQKLEKIVIERAEAKQFKANLDSMLLTTGSHFVGYRIVKYLDIVCEEVIFKNSFMNRISAGLEDLGNSISFRETEMSGATDLISRAREYVKKKFKNTVAKLGANAALGIDFESSIGTDVVRVTMFGTAVYIEKDNE